MASILELTENTQAASDDIIVLHDVSSNITGKITKTAFLSEYQLKTSLYQEVTDIYSDYQLPVFSTVDNTSYKIDLTHILDKSIPAIPDLSAHGTVSSSFLLPAFNSTLGLNGTVTIADISSFSIPAVPSLTLIGSATSSFQIPIYDTTTSTIKKIEVGNLPSPIKRLEFNASASTSYTLVTSDEDKVVTCTNAAANTVTINAGVFAVGAQVHFRQGGAGQITFTAGAGVTIQNAVGANPKTRAQYSLVTLYKETSGENWVLFGDLEKTA